jgi:glutamine synthetase
MAGIQNSSVPAKASTPQDFFDYCKEVGAELVDLKFCDLLGTWQHCAFPVDELDEDTFKDGLGFDGSSIRGWQDISVSDMLAIPQPETTRLDSFFKEPTVSILADIADPVAKQEYDKDPRHVAKKVTEYVRRSGLADTVFIGPEPEFFIFDEVRYEQNQHRGMYEIDSVEGAWNTARFEEPNLGYKPSYKGGYFPVSPTDTFGDLRAEMVFEMKKIGIAVEAHHHEVGTAGQSEIDMRFQPLLQMGDQMMWYKYIVKNVAKRHDKTVTFMAKPIFQDNGSGMHTHISLWKDGKPLFAGKEYAGLSQMALYAIGGLLKHAASILAFAAPTTNSYRRLVPGYEAPVNLAYSSRNRSAAIRIPMYSESPKAKRLEFRCPDPSCNPYLSFAAIAMAVMDGIQNQIDPGSPLDKNIYELEGADKEKVPNTPGSLAESFAALKRDHKYLLEGGVFSEELIQTWIDYKTANEIDEISLRPHPHEFHLYYDA